MTPSGEGWGVPRLSAALFGVRALGSGTAAGAPARADYLFGLAIQRATLSGGVSWRGLGPGQQERN